MLVIAVQVCNSEEGVLQPAAGLPYSQWALLMAKGGGLGLTKLGQTVNGEIGPRDCIVAFGLRKPRSRERERESNVVSTFVIELSRTPEEVTCCC